MPDRLVQAKRAFIARVGPRTIVVKKDSYWDGADPLVLAHATHFREPLIHTSMPAMASDVRTATKEPGERRGSKPRPVGAATAAPGEGRKEDE